MCFVHRPIFIARLALLLPLLATPLLSKASQAAPVRASGVKQWVLRQSPRTQKLSLHRLNRRWASLEAAQRDLNGRVLAIGEVSVEQTSEVAVLVTETADGQNFLDPNHFRQWIQERTQRLAIHYR